MRRMRPLKPRDLRGIPRQPTKPQTGCSFPSHPHFAPFSEHRPESRPLRYLPAHNRPAAPFAPPAPLPQDGAEGRRLEARDRQTPDEGKRATTSEGPLCSLMRGLWLKWHLAAASPRGGHPTPPPTPLTPTPLGRGATNSPNPPSTTHVERQLGFETEGDASRLRCFVAPPRARARMQCASDVATLTVRVFTHGPPPRTPRHAAHATRCEPGEPARLI